MKYNSVNCRTLRLSSGHESRTPAGPTTLRPVSLQKGNPTLTVQDSKKTEDQERRPRQGSSQLYFGPWTLYLWPRFDVRLRETTDNFFLLDRLSGRWKWTTLGNRSRPHVHKIKIRKRERGFRHLMDDNESTENGCHRRRVTSVVLKLTVIETELYLPFHKQWVAVSKKFIFQSVCPGN